MIYAAYLSDLEATASPSLDHAELLFLDTTLSTFLRENYMAASDSLARCTVRLHCEDGVRSSVGTSFLFRVGEGDPWTPLLITNRHVVEGFSTAHLSFSRASNLRHASPENSENVTVINLQSLVVYHPDPRIDLAAIMLGRIVNQMEAGNNPISLTAIRESDLVDDDVELRMRFIEDVIVVGYPQGLWDQYRNLPLFRTGVTASSALLDYNNEPKFLIDCSIYPGSSGSPVFLYNSGVVLDAAENTASFGERVKLLGVVFAVQLYQANGRVTETTPAAAQAMAQIGIPSNLGVVVKAREILTLVDHALKTT